MKGRECEGVHTRTLGAVHVRTRLIAQQQSTVLSAGVYGAERVAALAVAAVVGEGVAPAERTGHGRGSLAEHGVEQRVAGDERAQRVKTVSLQAVRCNHNHNIQHTRNSYE